MVLSLPVLGKGGKAPCKRKNRILEFEALKFGSRYAKKLNFQIVMLSKSLAWVLFHILQVYRQQMHLRQNLMCRLHKQKL